MEISLGTLITIVLFVLKVTGKLIISWGWVFAPTLINIGLFFAALATLLVMKLASE